jgi:hypothetical protein
MTKIGEGGVNPRPTEAVYHKQLQDSIVRFENALSGYQLSNDPEESAHLQAIMSQQMAIIRASVSEIKRLGIHKQGEVVVSDYNHYRTDPSPERLTILQQDLSTLQEYNYLSD